MRNAARNSGAHPFAPRANSPCRSRGGRETRLVQARRARAAHLRRSVLRPTDSRPQGGARKSSSARPAADRPPRARHPAPRRGAYHHSRRGGSHARHGLSATISRTVLEQSPKTARPAVFRQRFRARSRTSSAATRATRSTSASSAGAHDPNIESGLLRVDRRSKLEALCRIVDVQNVKRAIMFCATKMMCDQLTEQLCARGYAADKLHGDMTQAMPRARDAPLPRRQGRVPRRHGCRGGADSMSRTSRSSSTTTSRRTARITSNRIGRTGRAGRSGRAITFVAGREIRKLEGMNRLTKGRIRRERVPSLEEVGGKTHEPGLRAPPRDARERRIHEARLACRSPARPGHAAHRHRERAAPHARRRHAARHGRGTRARPRTPPRPGTRENFSAIANTPTRSPRRMRDRPERQLSDVSDEPGMTRLVITAAGRLSDIRPATSWPRDRLSGTPREAIGAIPSSPSTRLSISPTSMFPRSSNR